MLKDNIVNMDTRTVISGIPLGDFQYESLILVSSLAEIPTHKFNQGLLRSCANDAKSINTLNDVILFITNHKCNFELEISKTSLSSLSDWIIDDASIHHIDRKYFEIIAAKIEISNREVINWTQPMVKPLQDGICAFVCKNFNGVLHFLVQAKLECGNFDIIELAPTVQSLTEKLSINSPNNIPYLDYVLGISEDKILFDTYQSEEGGRFYREQNRNMIVFADDDFPESTPDNFIWMTYSQLQTFIKHNNYINIQARSLMAALSFNLC